MTDIERRLSGEPEEQVTKADMEIADKLGVPLENFLNDFKKCSICGKYFSGYGHNPYPFGSNGKMPFGSQRGDRCCDECNNDVVIPHRIQRAMQMRHQERRMDSLK